VLTSCTARESDRDSSLSDTEDRVRTLDAAARDSLRLDDIEKRADEGDLQALRMLAGSSYFRKINPQASREAFGTLQRRAQSEGGDARRMLARLYLGDDSLRKALPLWKKQADEGPQPGEAAYTLSRIYSGEIGSEISGEAVPRDSTQSLRWRRTAADLGHAPAQRDLAALRRR
jgi:TPR repeat protein